MGFSNGRKVLLLSLLLAAAAVFTCLSVASASLEPQRHRKILLLEDEDEGEAVVAPTKKKTTTTTISSSFKNKTKLLQPSSSSSSSYDSTDTKPVKSSSTSTKNQTKLIKPVSSSLKNKTKAVKSDSDGDGYTLEKTKIKTLNSTSKIKTLNSTSKIKIAKSLGDLSSSTSESKIKKLNSTSKGLSDSAKSGSISTKKASDLLKIKTSKSNADEKTQPTTDKINKKKEISDETNIKEKKKSVPSQQSNSDQNQNQKKKQQTSNSNWQYKADEDADLVSEFRDLPSKFQKTFLPDLQRISSSSKIYLSNANKEITRNFKPYVGNKYASSAATAISCAFIIIPFLIVSLLFNQIKAFFSLQKLLIFIQVYLSIYFTILCLSSVVTGLEPLKFFYATSRSTYVWLQVLQTLGYVLYLLILLMYLVLVFSTESGLGSKFLGLAQTFVGFAVGLHYYMTVFHRVVLHQPPKTSWKVHAVYSTCFLVISLLAGADRRKKAYLTEGGEEGKKS